MRADERLLYISRHVSDDSISLGADIMAYKANSIMDTLTGIHHLARNVIGLEIIID